MSDRIEIAKDCYCQNKISEMYHIVKIPKRNGKLRTLEIPNGMLGKSQRIIKKYLTESTKCSPFATAYKEGTKIKYIAYKHFRHKLLLKLDIRDFFGSITKDLVKSKVFQCADGENLTNLCCYNGYLPQGACTSPIISNLVMKDFDDELGCFCTKHNIIYSRYSDDMFFSGDFNPKIIIKKVREMLQEMGMELNNEKTILARRGSRQMVLGIIVNEKIQVSSDYRRKIRQEVYYCNKYGVRNHILKSNAEKYIKRNEKNNVLFVDAIGYLRSLMGRISYVLYINPQDSKMSQYYEKIRLWKKVVDYQATIRR